MMILMIPGSVLAWIPGSHMQVVFHWMLKLPGLRHRSLLKSLGSKATSLMFRFVNLGVVSNAIIRKCRFVQKRCPNKVSTDMEFKDRFAELEREEN